MSSTSKLKEQARRHEQREEWDRAIQVYQRVLAADEDSQSDVELPLFNRIGDLYLRLNRSAEAVQYYEEAAERYAAAGLFNNAIALCNKALRYASGRATLLQKLGSYCAEQGFVTDARRWYLQYAEVQFRSGKLDEAFSALEEFAETTEDPEIRELLAERLLTHERPAEAVMQLVKAYTLRVHQGDTEEAETLRTRILELDDSIDLDAAVGDEDEEPRKSPGPRRASAGLETLPDMGSSDELHIETVADAMGYGDDGSAVATEPEPGSETAVSEDGATVAGIAEAEAATDAETTADAETVAGEPTSVPEEYGVIEPESLAGEDEGSPPVEDDEGGAVDVGIVDVAGTWAGDTELAEEDEIGEPLPLLSGTEDVATADDADVRTGGAEFDLKALDAAVGDWQTGSAGSVEEVPDVDATLENAEALLAEGDRAGAAQQLTALHEALADSGQPEQALDVVERLLDLDADDMQALQRRVEYAFRVGQQSRLIMAYLGLAAALERTGADDKARAVYSRVLDLDPDNARATRAVRDIQQAERDYVDLGSLMLEDDDEGSTRFVVEEEEPTGDEEKDFADILAKFKAKVSENLGTDDPAGHYDLGLAYKEMGLIDEAIVEFQTALRGGADKLRVYEELGRCFVTKEQYNVALKVLSRAAEVADADPTDLVGVNYHLGRCYEALGRPVEAKEAYERVMAIDIDFEDVAERVSRL